MQPRSGILLSRCRQRMVSSLTETPKHFISRFFGRPPVVWPKRWARSAVQVGGRGEAQALANDWQKFAADIPLQTPPPAHLQFHYHPSRLGRKVLKVPNVSAVPPWSRSIGIPGRRRSLARWQKSPIDPLTRSTPDNLNAGPPELNPCISHALS